MRYFDELRDGADLNFLEWLRALADPADETARAAAWGLRLELDGLTPEEVLERSPIELNRLGFRPRR